MGNGFPDKYPAEGVSFLDICREFLEEIEKREAHRSGPGTAARRTLEAIAESARLSRELSGLDDYGD